MALLADPRFKKTLIAEENLEKIKGRDILEMSDPGTAESAASQAQEAPPSIRATKKENPRKQSCLLTCSLTALAVNQIPCGGGKTTRKCSQT